MPLCAQVGLDLPSPYPVGTYWMGLQFGHLPIMRFCAQVGSILIVGSGFIGITLIVGNGLGLGLQFG